MYTVGFALGEHLGVPVVPAVNVDRAVFRGAFEIKHLRATKGLAEHVRQRSPDPLMVQRKRPPRPLILRAP